MDYHFQRNFAGQPEAQFSMDHEAIGFWLTDELGSNNQQLEHLLQVIDSLEKGQRWEYFDDGTDYRLHLTRDGATISAALLESESTMPVSLEGCDVLAQLDYYDHESMSHCGLDDFKQLLLGWQAFLDL